ncbi:MAG: hypothetical protein QXD45_05125 [Candidatus Bathyarchaeia archaeon]
MKIIAKLSRAPNRLRRNGEDKTAKIGTATATEYTILFENACKNFFHK